MILAGPVPAATDEPTVVRLPFGTGQLAVVCMHAANTLMLFDPEFATKRLFESAAGHRAFAVVELIPAQRDNPNPDGLLPTK